MTSAATAQAIIDAIDAWILAYYQDEAVSSYSINGRTFTFGSVAEAQKAREYWVSVAQRLSGRRKSFARFDG